MSFYKRTALSSEQEEDGQQLRVAEFVAYGSYDASIEGSIRLILRYWGKSSMVCQQKSDAL